MDSASAPEAHRPARTVRALVIAVCAAVVTVALGVIASVLLTGLAGEGRRTVDVTISPTRPASGTADSSTPPVPTGRPTEPAPRVTIVVREPATISAETVLGAVASLGTLLAGLGTLIAAYAALRTTQAAGQGERRRRKTRARTRRR